VRDTGGTGFWHELYFMRGGMEAVYLDVARPSGFLNFAPAEPARGAMFSARDRLKVGAEEVKEAAPVTEEELYDRG
jgi:hypothetical protein